MNTFVESFVLSQAINDWEDILNFEKRRLVLKKCRPEHFLSWQNKELFIFLQKEWLEDDRQSIESLMPKALEQGLLDIFLDITNLPVTESPIELNINYLLKYYLEHEYIKALAEGDRQKLSDLDSQFKKLESQMVTENSYYDDQVIKQEIDEAIQKGIQIEIFDTYIPGLDKYFKMVKKQTTALTGIPTAGKSNFADAIAINMAYKHDWKVVFFSPENQPIRLHLMNIARKYAGGPVMGTKKEFNSDWIIEHFKFINTNDIEHKIEFILEAAAKHHPDLFIIDPWNEIEITKQPETQFISEALSKIKSFTYRSDCHVIIVAHPTKLKIAEEGKYAGQYPPPTAYDISGSANWYNKPDNVLSLWRDKNSREVQVNVQKIKFENITGNRGIHKLNYDVETGMYFI